MITDKHKKTMAFALIYFISGAMLMILSSVFWMNFTGVYKHFEKYDITTGEIVDAVGQTLGQVGIVLSVMCLSRVLRDFFKLMQVLNIFAFFLLMLAVYDIIDILLLNPYEVSAPKFMGFVVAVITTILRLTWTTKK